MRKLFLILVTLLFVSVGNADAWFVANPRDTAGGANVRIPVYNNSGADLDEGDVVVWDIGSATGDDDLYVTTTTTSDTGLVAGVIASTCTTGSDCSLIVYGLAQCDLGAQGVGAGGILCTSVTTGGGDLCNTANVSAAYGIAGVAGATGDQIECILK